MITYKNISKSFKTNRALDNVSFTIEKGNITAYIGPNGAGKTTTINILMGFLHPDSGQINHPWGSNTDIRSKIGCLLSLPTGEQKLSVYDNLVFYSKLYNIEKENVMRAINKVGLEGMINHKLFTLSSGYRKRFEIALALLNDSELIIMDEPTANLDVDSKKEIIQLIQKLKTLNKTFFITSHDLHFISEIADRMIFLKNGQIYCESTRDELLKQFDGKRFRIRGDISKIKKVSKFTQYFEKENKGLYLIYAADRKQSRLLLDEVKDHVEVIEKKELTLYDIYSIIFSEKEKLEA